MMLNFPSYRLLPAPGVLRRVQLGHAEHGLLQSMTRLFEMSENSCIRRYIWVKLRISSDESENPSYYQILEGVLPTLALLNVDPFLTISVEKTYSRENDNQVLLNYQNEFDISTNYRKAKLFQSLIMAGFKRQDICKSFGISKNYLSKSSMLLSLPDQYLSLFISGKIEDVNAAYTLRNLTDNDGLLFNQLMSQGLSPQAALKFVLADESGSR